MYALFPLPNDVCTIKCISTGLMGTLMRAIHAIISFFVVSYGIRFILMTNLSGSSLTAGSLGVVDVLVPAFACSATAGGSHCVWNYKIQWSFSFWEEVTGLNLGQATTGLFIHLDSYLITPGENFKFSWTNNRFDANLQHDPSFFLLNTHTDSLFMRQTIKKCKQRADIVAIDLSHKKVTVIP